MPLWSFASGAADFLRGEPWSRDDIDERVLAIFSEDPTVAHGALESSRLPLTRCAILLASVLLCACSVLGPTVRDPFASEGPPAPVVVPRSPEDIQRISELEAQLADLQRQLADKQKQLAERQKQSSDEKQRLEVLLKENQQRSNELQAKLDAILAIDRELRRSARSAE